MKAFCTITALAIAGLATQADAFTSINGDRVNPINNVTFEVIPRGAGRNTDIWCSASQFARRALGASWSQRIYIVSGRGQSVTTNRRTAVQFTIDPQAAGVTPLQGGIRFGLQPGDNMTVQTGEGYCGPAPIGFL